MAKESGILVEATAIESLGNDLFAVKLDNGVDIKAHISGKIRKHRIRILPGDRIQVELSPYDLSRGRITFRHK